MDHSIYVIHLKAGTKGKYCEREIANKSQLRKGRLAVDIIGNTKFVWQLFIALIIWIINLFCIKEVDVKVEVASFNIVGLWLIDIVYGEGDESPFVICHSYDKSKKDEEVEQWGKK